MRSRIRHTVAFTLVYAEGSAGERGFLDAAERLARLFQASRCSSYWLRSA
jgi:hypothetical protein